MASKIFISYRRDDSAGHAGRLHDRLVHEFGRDVLFMDVDAIPLGKNFVKVLGDEVGKCDVLLAVIGPGWIDARDEHGNRRLNNPQDVVRIEVGTALKRDIRVIPIFLDGTAAPKADQLPDDLKELAFRNGLGVRHASFQSDVEKLVRALKPETPQPPSPRLPTKPPSQKAIKIQFGRPPKPRLIVPGGGSEAVDRFRDASDTPEMLVVPAGSFVMGRLRNSQRIFFERPFAIGRFTVTNQEWLSAYNAGGVDRKLFELNDEELMHPVTRISWHDAKQYVEWLSQITSYEYRLPSEAEWEYAARAGSDTHFWWGDAITAAQANYDGSEYREFNEADMESISDAQEESAHSDDAGDEVVEDDEQGVPEDYTTITTVPVDTYHPNPWGLYQVHGNVWEWCADVWHESIEGAPADGTPWAQRQHRKGRKVVRGGSWACSASSLSSTGRWRYRATYLGQRDIGFRVARTI